MKYITAVEVAKMIRRDLAEKFPGVKFSVRKSDGGTINLDWTDGPTHEAVEKVVGLYEGKGFDGMIDLAYHYRHYMTPDGRLHYYGTNGTVDNGGANPREVVDLPPGAEEVSLYVGYLFCNILTVLTLLGILEGKILLQGVISDSMFLVAGIAYTVGTVLNWKEMQIRR